MFELMDAYGQSAVIKVIGIGGGDARSSPTFTSGPADTGLAPDDRPARGSAGGCSGGVPPAPSFIAPQERHRTAFPARLRAARYSRPHRWQLAFIGTRSSNPQTDLPAGHADPDSDDTGSPAGPVRKTPTPRAVR